MSDEKPLKQIIDNILKSYGYQEQLDEIELIKMYHEIVGKMFANHTKNIALNNKVLYVQLDSAVLKQEMNYIKEGLAQKINERMGKHLVEKIMIR